ncbi:hypothetical protein [Gallaecimonas mangrovi]|uniref:hypothetical protein n=1 Tax=Gallaecimonas mangrovi TaxID=2291597 RepID=UPI000E200AC6|nr:hypothetical protein [Gallaecimonas mangrovi]
MGLPFELGQRHYRHMVSIIRGEVGSRQQFELGRPYRPDSSRRQRVLEQWGMEQASPRKTMFGTIDAPLARREKVAYAARLKPEIQQVLGSGFEGSPVDRRQRVNGVKGRLHVGPTHSPITSGLPPLRGGSMAATVASVSKMATPKRTR